MSTMTAHPVHQERPERSRNAKAQARHRAKRKAYIEQLEQTVTKLQIALGFTPEEEAALPPPLVKIRELEQENMRLEKENEELRRLLVESGNRNFPVELSRRSSPAAAFKENRANDHDPFRRRKMTTGSIEGIYISPNDTPTHNVNEISRPPPLTIPQPMHHQYSHISSATSHHGMNGSSSMFSLHAPAFQMPNTPSGSSTTSSPPFSPAQMQDSSHSPVNHQPSVANGHMMASYAQQTHYTPVKVEEEQHYAPTNHQHAAYTLSSSYSQPARDNGMGGWHAYSSERAPMHTR